MSMKGVLGIAAGAGILILGTMFLVYVFAATTDGVDMSGSDYEEQYNATTDVTILTLTSLKFIGPIFGVCVIFAALFTIRRRMR